MGCEFDVGRGVCEGQRIRLGTGGGILKQLRTGNEVFTLCLLLKPRENHLGSLDVLGGVKEVLKQGVVTPNHAGSFVGGRVRITISLARLTAKEAVQIGTLLVTCTLLNSVALRTLGPEVRKMVT